MRKGVINYQIHNLTMSIYCSIYISRMSVDHTEEFIRHIMKFYRIGQVSPNLQYWYCEIDEKW